MIEILSRRTTDARLDTVPTTGIGGVFHVELRCAKSGLIKQSFSMPNIITTTGLNEFLGGSSSTLDTLLSHAGVGTDSAAPAIGDTALGAQVGGRVTATGGVPDETGTVTASPEYVWQKKTRQWATGEGNGNLTEIGFFAASTGGVMWCRALFRDSGGTAVTVTKTSSDILRVTYEVRVYPALGDATQTALAISGTNYDFTWRPVSRTLWPINLISGGLVIIARNTQAQLGTTTALLARFDTTFGLSGSLDPDGTPTCTWDSGALKHVRSHTWTPTAGACSARSIMIGALNSVSGMRCPYHGTIATTLSKTAVNQLVLNYEIPWTRVTP